MLLPNFGRVCGYPLYNNIMNFCYNNFVEVNDKLPLNHGLILNNDNFFKKVSNNNLISKYARGEFIRTITLGLMCNLI